MDHFSLGPLKIYYYSLCLLTAVWVGYWLAVRRATQYKIARSTIEDCIMLSLVFGVIGARIAFVGQNLGYFSVQVSESWRLTTGGLSIHGAIIGGGLAIYWYARRKKLSFWQLTDTLALPVLAGQIIGRLGNYFNQELFGYPTRWPWGIYVDQIHRRALYMMNTHFHPTFLYEMILNFIGLIVISRWQFKRPGQLTGAYLIVFSISRFVTEIFRISDRVVIGLSAAQVVSLGLIVIGTILLHRHRALFDPIKSRHP